MSEKDFELVPTVKLAEGIEMPLVGFGVYEFNEEECEKYLLDALSVGYRLIDTAEIYENEAAVGRAWRKSGINRDELFITTKVWLSSYGDGKTMNTIDGMLKKLQTDYIDLLLLHEPYCDYYGAWRDMEKAVKQGKVRALGVSNFYFDRYYDLLQNFEMKPLVNQLETNVFTQQREMQDLCKQYGTHLEAWSPFNTGENGLFTNPVLAEIAQKYNKSIAQVALRCLVQRGITVIPKSSKKERMIQNKDIFDFNLSDEDMQKIATLNESNGWSCNWDDHNSRMDFISEDFYEEE